MQAKCSVAEQSGVAMEAVNELKSGCEAVRLASKLCEVVQQQLLESEKVDKEDSSPVTVADYGAQALVAWSLMRSMGTISLVAEEDSADLRKPDSAGMITRIAGLVNRIIADVPGTEPLSEDSILDLIDMGGSSGGAEGTHWVLDPIDGTRGFVAMRQYAVCLGLIKNGEVVQGVLGCPNLPRARIRVVDGESGAAAQTLKDDVGCLFSAVKGQGAKTGLLWDDQLPTEEISVENLSDMGEVQFMESFDSRHSNHGITAAVADKLGMTLPALRMDSQVKYGALSRGDATLFMRFPPADYREKIWDHCAGTIIVTEAGGKITDASGNPLDFSKGRWLDFDRGIIAAPPEVHQKVLEALQDC
ncbi:hypothetical protein BSKO_08595 [Bryopsis sp. KO-2023]|nr:hypothetical protein BSKO_08595 [Bryopsis sp. KO-2023]